jgi:xylan 1,4-beta-xylosidase
MHTSKYKIIFVLTVIYCFITKPVVSQQSDSTILHLADPTIFYHNNTYYLYGTVEKNAGNGFLVYTSTDLTNWKLSELNSGYALKKGDAFGRSGFWAPQVFAYHDKFYMAYVANEQIAIAESKSPAGPFIQQAKDSLATTVKQIDPFLFIDDDGTKYLYHVRLVKGNRIFVARINEDLSAIDTTTLRECLAATETWENTASSPWPVAEGPSVLKHKGVYYLFYTANDFRSPDYAVGYATSNHPLGPWTKHAGNPILHKSMIGINGTGHGDFFMHKQQLFYVFHTHNSTTKVGPRNTAIIKAKFRKAKRSKIDELAMELKSFYFLQR